MLDIKLTAFPVEVLTDDFLVQCILKPLGDMVIYLNDKNRGTFSVSNASLYPVAADRAVKGVQKEQMTIQKRSVHAVTVSDPKLVEKIQMLRDSRTVVFYTSRYAFQGDLHVNQDAPDEDLLDESRNYFAISQARIFPLKPLAKEPLLKVPLLILRREAVQAYHRR